MSPLLFSLFVEDLELFLQRSVDCGLTVYDITLILLLFTHEHQKRYFHSWLRHSCNYCFCCSFSEIKIDLTLKK